MKKIILLVFILIPHYVYAATFYTDYEILYEGLESKLPTSDTLKEESYRLYNTFLYVKTNEEYAIKGENSSSSPYLDETDYKEEERYSLNYKDTSYNYETVCPLDVDLVSEISFTNFSNKLFLSELLTKYKETNLYPNYGYKNIFDYGNLFDNREDKDVVLTTNSGLYLKYNNIELKDLTLNLISKNKTNEPGTFLITINQNSENSYKVNYEQNFGERNVISIRFLKEFKNFLEEKNLNIQDGCVSYYTNKEKLYKYYNLEKQYLNNYVEEFANDNIDYNDYKEFYNYYVRKKIVLPDIINLSSPLNINEHIIYNSISLNDLVFEDNVNYEKSGLYDLNIYYQNNLLGVVKINYVKILEEEPSNEEEESLPIIEESLKEPQDNTYTDNTYTESYYAILESPIKNIISNDNYETTTKHNTEINKNNDINSNKDTNLNKDTKTTSKILLKTVSNDNNKIIQKDDNIFISFIISLILILIGFEIVLLYVKRKYFKE